MTYTYCGAMGWHDANEYMCGRPEGHDGPHMDFWEGWEW